MLRSLVIATFSLIFASGVCAQTGTTGGAKPTPAQKLAPVLPAQPPQVGTGQKPSPIGQPIVSTPGNPGYKPAPPKLVIKEPPSPKP